MGKRKRPIPKPLHQPIYGVIRTLVAALGAIDPHDTLLGLRKFARVFAAAPFNQTRVRRAEDHLAVAFPEWSPQRRREYALRAYEHLFMLAGETMVMPRLLNEDAWRERVELGNLRESLNTLLNDRPAVLITGHCGNWELLGYTLSLLGFPMHALYRPLDLKPLDAWVRRTRERRGLILIDKFGAGEDLPAVIEAGGLPAFVADQNAGDKGLFVPFFGRLASSYKSIGLLALRYRAPVICGMARRLVDDDEHAADGSGDPDRISRHENVDAPLAAGDVRLHPGGLHYRVEVADVIRPEEYQSQPDPLFYITARYRRGIETMVRRAPEQYLWMHRYWRSRPRHEKLGRPFPEGLLEKLRALPWMTESELETVQAHSARDTTPAGAGA